MRTNDVKTRLKSGGTAIGTMVFAIGAATPSFTMTTATTFIAGDVLTIIAPATADPTLTSLAWTLSGTL